MALTRDYIETVNKRVKQDPEFAKALFDEATSLLYGNNEFDMSLSKF